MKLINNLLKQYFPPIQYLSPGIYHTRSQTISKNRNRLHLRIEKSGEGILIINAKTVMHLNTTATEFAYHLIKKTPEMQVINSMANRYNISKDQAIQDYHNFLDILNKLDKTIDLDPVTFYGVERITPYSKRTLAPYRLDCALTYRVSTNSHQKVAPQDRVIRELTTDEWIYILQKAWKAGIPHVIFTGGEPTMRNDLPQLIAETEKMGMVSGLLSDGLRLNDKKYRASLIKNGLDHIMHLLDPDNPKSWNALAALMAEDIFVTVHLTITERNKKIIESVIEKVASQGARSLSLTVANKSLTPTIKAIQDKAAHLNLSLVWDIPVPYSDFHPVALEMQEKNDRLIDGAGKAWLYLEPDGDVLPEQGINRVMGNLLTEKWETIWKRFK